MGLKSVLIFSVFFLSAQAQLAYNGSECPSSLYTAPCVSPYLAITNEKLVGIWYLQYSIPHFFELEMKCSFLNISELGEYHLHYVKTEFHNHTGEPRETIGTIEYLPDGFTSFFYTELGLPFDYQTVALTSDYWVLTSCNECGFYDPEGAGIYAYIFTKFQFPSCETQDDALAALAKCKIPKSALTLEDQNNCPFC